MTPIAQFAQRIFRSMTFRGFRALLRNRREHPMVLPGTKRSTHGGKLGPHHRYTIHASPAPEINGAKLEQKVDKLVKKSEERFLEGQFFQPIARQMNNQAAVITARLQQGNEGDTADHYTAITPDFH